jgi:hypothetical protein
VGNEAELPAALLTALDAEGDGGARARAARYTIEATVDGTLGVHLAVGAPV